jgi:hypothetical protein
LRRGVVRKALAELDHRGREPPSSRLEFERLRIHAAGRCIRRAKENSPLLDARVEMEREDSDFRD